ncbi:MAG: hypothetical protein SWK76_01095 [Actinomycetota bacterium]|nr:hypothetical protein [Actinomycetota bacterium]
MQKEPTKGFFIDSSYRRSGILRSLIRGLFHPGSKEENAEDEYTYRQPTSPTPNKKGDFGGSNNMTKKEAS